MAKILFPGPGERIPYTALMPDQQHALHDWLREHRVDPGRVPLYARFDHDAATGEWRIPLYWHGPDGRMRLNPDGDTVRKLVVRRRELSPLPWPTWGRPTVTWNGVDISECVADIQLGNDQDDEVACCDPDCTCGDGDPGRPIETIDTRGLL